MSYDALIVDFGGVLTTPLQDSMVAFAEALAAFVRTLDFLRRRRAHARGGARHHDRSHGEGFYLATVGRCASRGRSRW